MAYQEVTNTSYGQRVKKSAGGIVTGFVMFIAATCLLWWNEGRSVKTTKMLEDAQGNYVEMENIKAVDPQFEGKLVHATGMATTTDTLVDDEFGIKDLALSMKRDVEYFQWVEHSKEEKRDKLGGGEETITTYTYKKEWVSTPQESSAFHDPQYKNSNFVLMEVADKKQLAQNVTFGAYQLSESQINALPDKAAVTVSLPQETLVQLDHDLLRTRDNRMGGGYSSYGSPAPQPHATMSDSAGVQQYHAAMVHTSGNVVYLGASNSSPAVGDVRITYTKAAPGNVSLLARVTGNTFSNYVAKNGKQFSTISVGTLSADEMFQTEHDNNSTMTWLLRLAGLVLCIAGLKAIFGILETLLKVVPFLANILGLGVRLICSVVGFVWSLIVIALAWLFYRPLLGIALLVVAALVIFAFSKKGKALIAKHVTGRGDQPQPAVAAATPQQSQAPQQPQAPANPPAGNTEKWD